MNPRGKGWQEKLAAMIKSLTAEFKPSVLATPLGLFHQDHVAVRAAVLVDALALRRAMARLSGSPLCTVENAAAEGVRDEFRRAGHPLEAADCGELNPLSGPLKLAAIHCYASQIRGLGYSSDAGTAPSHFEFAALFGVPPAGLHGSAAVLGKGSIRANGNRLNYANRYQSFQKVEKRCSIPGSG